jgi:streptogramin lyase
MGRNMKLLVAIGAWLACGVFVANVYGRDWTISNFAGTGVAGWSGDGGPATQAQLNQPYGISRGPDGALYVCDCENQLVRRIDREGKIWTFAGSRRAGYSGDGGPATQATLHDPYEVRFDRAGNVFFVEMKNNVVRKVDAKTGIVSTVAGTGKPGFSGDEGPATAAALNQPHSIQFDSHGDLYICDIGNNRIRKVDMASGVISTFAGTGTRGATGDEAPIHGTPLNGPRAIDFDRGGNLWLALREGNAVYLLDLARGTIHHAAGTGKKGFTGNGGLALAATLSGPKGLSIGPDGNVYLADTESHSIRLIDVAKGKIEVVAGTGEKADGPPGEALRCRFARPHGVFVDADGSIFVGDTENNRVRVIRPPR